ncbi:hypothetical protein K493DRAFT_321397 [Basidiobolus meristosporus CBS 931.73]|uniref:WH1-domain-containing protein n=1 Tax=Basidiobolus meristosporus CBS 931.73 TaxID=1314790 RepID=A0A1Y1WVM0_9FUNG|nr:hypothetical protein K493DRAFT_321397 [Basidiobolus meristosporus CBS 931.73]|eukprot:ORX77358.1 hypothetical protein K493DRAFT_321397 [Basidiobolus meristosporus CBS 931.73]
MPSLTLANVEDKARVKRCVGSGTNKILTATVAELYVASEVDGKSSWEVTGKCGALALVRDQLVDKFHFRLVGLKDEEGILWEMELEPGFEYVQERAYFHSFHLEGKLMAFSFAEEHEAHVFYQKVLSRERLGNRQRLKKSRSLQEKKSPVEGPSLMNYCPGFIFSLGNPVGLASLLVGPSKPKLDKSMIGTPSNFRHVGHVGFNPELGFDVQNVDPEWSQLFEELGKYGLTMDRLNTKQTRRFIYDFVEAHGGPTGEGNPAEVTAKVMADPLSPPGSPSQAALPPPPPPPPPMPSLPTPALTPTPEPPADLPTTVPVTDKPLSAVPGRLTGIRGSVSSSDLLSSIRGVGGVKGLRHIELQQNEVRVTASDPNLRDTLLSNIRNAGGVASLRKVDRSKLRRPAVQNRGELAEALASALSQRSRVLALSDSEAEPEESDESDWD